MADVMRLTDGVDTIDFNPRITGYRRPDLYFQTHNEALDGTLYIYERGSPKQFHEVPVVNISSANAVILNGWCEDKTSLTFTPDLTGAPGTTKTVRIVNQSRPLQIMPIQWSSNYQGTLMIRET